MKRNLFLLLSLIIVNQSFAAYESLSFVKKVSSALVPGGEAKDALENALMTGVNILEGEDYTQEFTNLYQKVESFLNKENDAGMKQFKNLFEYIKSLYEKAQLFDQQPTIQKSIILIAFGGGSWLQKGSLGLIALLTVYGTCNLCVNLKNKFFKKKAE